MMNTKHLLVASGFVYAISLFSCFGMQSKSPQEIVQQLQGLQKLGFEKQEIVRVFKKNIQSSGQSLRSVTDEDSRTVLHVSCKEGDIEITQLILDILDDDEAKAMLMQHTKLGGESYQETPLLLVVHANKYHTALSVIKYADKRFGRDFTKKMILETNYSRSNAANIPFLPENVDLVLSILEHLADKDFKTVVETNNAYGFSILGRVQQDSCPTEIQIQVCLIYQELYGMSDEEVLKLVFRKYWSNFTEDLAKAKSEQVVKA